MDADVLASSGVICIEEITPGNRAVGEGEVPAGVHRPPRFSVALPDLGDAGLQRAGASG